MSAAIPIDWSVIPQEIFAERVASVQDCGVNARFLLTTIQPGPDGSLLQRPVATVVLPLCEVDRANAATEVFLDQRRTSVRLVRA